MALQHKAIDPERGENALEDMYTAIRKAERAITEADEMGNRMEGAKSAVDPTRFPAALRPVAVPAGGPGRVAS